MKTDNSEERGYSYPNDRESNVAIFAYVSYKIKSLFNVDIQFLDVINANKKGLIFTPRNKFEKGVWSFSPQEHQDNILKIQSYLRSIGIMFNYYNSPEIFQIIDGPSIDCLHELSKNSKGFDKDNYFENKYKQIEKMFLKSDTEI